MANPLMKMLQQLLNTCELNLDELEPATTDLIAEAQQLLEKERPVLRLIVEMHGGTINQVWADNPDIRIPIIVFTEDAGCTDVEDAFRIESGPLVDEIIYTQETDVRVGGADLFDPVIAAVVERHNAGREDDGKEPEKVCCPHCSSTNFAYSEYVERLYKNYRVDPDRGILFQAGSDRINWESNKDPALWCKDCNQEFPIPEGLVYDFE